MPIILNPKPDTRFKVIEGRLALLHKAKTHLSYWKEYWSDQTSLTQLMVSGKSGCLGEYQALIARHVNKNGLILEAGCGPGHIVAALLANGYRAEGVDYEFNAVNFANQHLPQGVVRRGDILALDYPDNSVDSYLSFGVVEHLPDGPLPALVEARRVLSDDGFALISVPYLNPGRKKMRETLLKENLNQPDDYFFHQFYFSKADFSGLLFRSGFEVVDTFPYAALAYLSREHPRFTWLWQSGRLPYRLRKPIKKYLENPGILIRNNYGHMIMFVCKPI